MSRTNKFVKLSNKQIKHRPIHIKADKSYLYEINAIKRNMIINNHQR
ncbi:MAG: hypothetical protein MJ158_02075 [Alphaproteobacteria bacterium]|nr:hypothetical protein [Alphaproteobacteria bacterium]